jgi:hypothetical protein
MGGTPAELPDPTPSCAVFRIRIEFTSRAAHSRQSGHADSVGECPSDGARAKRVGQRVQVALIDRMGHFRELTGQGYQFARVAGLATRWFGQTLH